MSKQNENPKGGASRREFLKATSFAAAGIVLTPILTACGGDEKKPSPRKAGGSGGSKAPVNKADNQPTTPNNASSGGTSIVKTVAELGDTGTLTLTALTAAAVTPTYLTISDTQTDAALASQVNGGKGPYDEGVKVTVDASGKAGVASVLFVLNPSGKALASEAAPLGGNHDFRFSRVLVVGKGQKASYEITDPVSHNVTIVTADDARRPGGGGTGTNGDIVSSDPLRRTGLYGVTCSMHNWEKAFIWVSEHAHCGVTACPYDVEKYRQGPLNGSVTLENVPVGSHKVDVYWEGAKVKTIDVEVTKGENKSFEVTL